MVEVVSPVQNGVVLLQHAAAVSLRRGGGGVAGVAELVLDGGVVEEGEAHALDVVEEGGGDAVVGDVEGTPVAAGLGHRGSDGVAAGWVESEEGDGGDGGGG